MQVQKIDNSVYHSQTTPAPVRTTSFRAKGLSPEIVSELNKKTGRFARFLNYAGEHQGEMLNILVTAFGTAIVCPMFIRFNPFSKEDKDTRAYSAWRQPISAIIAVAAQLTITKWFNNRMAMKASTETAKGGPAYTRADLRDCPVQSYLERGVKLQHPEWTKKQVEAEAQKLQTRIKKIAIERDRNLMKDRKFEYKDLLSQEYMDNTKENVIFKEYRTKYKEEIEKKFGKDVDNVGSIKLNKFFEGKLKDEAAKAGVDAQTFVQNRAAERMETEVLSEAVIKGYLRKLVDDKNDINQICEAIKFSEKDPVKFKEGLINYIKEIEPSINAEEKVFGKNTPKKVIETKIKEFAENVVDKLKNCLDYGTKAEKKETLIKDLGKTPEEIIQKIKIKKFDEAKWADAKKVFKLENTQLGLLVTLATLPITCGLLNWAYPRIMEYIMPEMSAKKKDPAKTQEKKEVNN